MRRGLGFDEVWKRLATTEAPLGFVTSPLTGERVRFYKDYDDLVWVDFGEVSLSLGHYDDLTKRKVKAHLKEIKHLIGLLGELRFHQNSEGL